MNQQTDYTNFAFISYSHKDMAVAKWLQKKLEGYKLPTEIHNDIEAKCRYLRPVFRDKTDLNTGILSDELYKELLGSKFLIILCSKYSAQSDWVSKEAEAFVDMGRLDRIIPVILPDDHSQEGELFPIFLREYFSENRDKELLGINEPNREKRLLKVVSKMLGVSFETLWKRHLRQKRIRIAVISALTVVLLVCAYLFAIPIDLKVGVSMQKSMLPVEDKISLTVKGAEYMTSTDEPDFEVIRLPGYKRFSGTEISLSSPFFEPVDTFISTGFGLKRVVDISMKRDDTFSRFEGNVYNDEMEPVEDVKVSVGEKNVLTDRSGYFSISLPLDLQRSELPISLEKAGYKTITREDEPPGTNLRFIIHRKW